MTKKKSAAQQQEISEELPAENQDTGNNGDVNNQTTSLSVVTPKDTIIRPGSLDVADHDATTSITSKELSEIIPGLDATTSNELSEMFPMGKDAQGITLLTIALKKINFMDEWIKQIEALLKRFKDVERRLVARVYQRRLTELNLVKQKTYIYGAEKADIKNFYDKFYKLTTICEEYAKKIVEIINTRVLTSQEKDILEKELKAGNGIAEVGTKMVSEMLPFIDQYKTTIELPQSSSTELAKDFRDLLSNTQSIARQAEVLFLSSFQDLLVIHPELRQDYQEIEVQTNIIYNRLMVGAGVVYMDGKQLGIALKTIIKALKNLSGDFESMKMQLLSTIRPPKKESRKSLLRSLVEGAVKWDMEGDLTE